MKINFNDVSIPGGMIPRKN